MSSEFARATSDLRKLAWPNSLTAASDLRIISHAQATIDVAVSPAQRLVICLQVVRVPLQAVEVFRAEIACAWRKAKTVRPAFPTTILHLQTKRDLKTDALVARRYWNRSLAHLRGPEPSSVGFSPQGCGNVRAPEPGSKTLHGLSRAQRRLAQLTAEHSEVKQAIRTARTETPFCLQANARQAMAMRQVPEEIAA